MDHLVIPLDEDHVRAAGDLVAGIARAAGAPGGAERLAPHVTVLAYSGGDAADVRAAVAAVVAGAAPFVVHAHGYGFFAGDHWSDLALHVPVVRSSALDRLHASLCEVMTGAGAQVAGWCQPELWSPHITLVDRGLSPATLGQGASWLAQRHHPSWSIRVDRLALTGGWSQRDRPADVIRLGGGRDREGT